MEYSYWSALKDIIELIIEGIKFIPKNLVASIAIIFLPVFIVFILIFLNLIKLNSFFILFFVVNLIFVMCGNYHSNKFKIKICEKNNFLCHLRNSFNMYLPIYLIEWSFYYVFSAVWFGFVTGFIIYVMSSLITSIPLVVIYFILNFFSPLNYENFSNYAININFLIFSIFLISYWCGIYSEQKEIMEKQKNGN